MTTFQITRSGSDGLPYEMDYEKSFEQATARMLELVEAEAVKLNGRVANSKKFGAAVKHVVVDGKSVARWSVYQAPTYRSRW